MTCSQCNKREATLFFDLTVNEQNFKVALCEACAKEKGPAFSIGKPPFSITDLMAALGETAPGGRPRQARVFRCPNCGLRYAQFQQTGRLGCSVCYEAFRDPLRTLVASIHGCTRHSGKPYQSPAGESASRAAPSTIANAKELEALKAGLHNAVKKEDYERAAELRDEIRKKS